MIGRLLCRLGFHRWEAWCENIGFGYHTDHMECKRPLCHRGYRYTSHRSDPVNR